MTDQVSQVPQVIVSDLLRVSIPNWKKFNPRADRVNFSWFRMENRFFEDQSIFVLNADQKILYLFILCAASKQNTETFEIRISYASALLKRDQISVKNDFFFLGRLALIELAELDTPHPILGITEAPAALCRQNGVTLPSNSRTTRRNVTERNETGRIKLAGIRLDYPGEFSRVWELYGRKGDKKKAFQEFQKLSLGESEQENLSVAIANHHVKNTDPTYRKDFERFLQTDWREWLNPVEAGNGVHPKTQGRLNAFAEYEKRLKAREEGGANELTS